MKEGLELFLSLRICLVHCFSGGKGGKNTDENSFFRLVIKENRENIGNNSPLQSKLIEVKMLLTVRGLLKTSYKLQIYK